MRKSAKVFSVLLLVWALLMVSGCQPATEAPAIETESPQQKTAPNPTPKLTEPPTPEPTLVPLPTANPLDLRFSVDGNEMYNIAGGGPVYCVAFAPDDSLMAMGGNAKIVIWETQKLTRDTILEGHTAPIMDMGWSPGNTLASIDTNGTLRLWDMNTLSENAVLETGKGYRLDWAPGGNLLVVGTLDGIIQLWDIDRGQQLISWDIPTNASVVSIDWSPNGNLIASGDYLGVIHLWDANSGATVAILDTYANELSSVNDLVWAPNGTMLATAHTDGNLRLWDTQTWEVLHSIQAHTDSANKVVWSPDSYLVASGGSDKSVLIWDPQTGGKVTGRGIKNQVWAMAWSHNGKMLAAGSAGMDTVPSGGIGPSLNAGNPSQIQISGIDTANPEAGLISLFVRLK